MDSNRKPRTSSSPEIRSSAAFHSLLPIRRITVPAVVVFCLWITAPLAPLSGQNTPRQPNPAFEEVQDQPGLPRVLLIGDSISIGYTIPTRTLLKGKANLHRIPENGGPTTRGLDNIDRWLGDGRWDVIHFNWGLHDLKFMDDGRRQVPLEQYRRNLRRLVARLKRTGAALIWASTTPVPDARVSPARKNDDVIAYNEAAQRIMGENHIAINDLYRFALPQLVKIQRPANVHFTQEGYEKLAAQVVSHILKALREKR